MSKPWRWVDNKGIQRELSLEALREALVSNIISQDTPIWRQGMDSFEVACQVPEVVEWCQKAPKSPKSPMNFPEGQKLPGHIVPATAQALEAMLRMANREKRGKIQTRKLPDRPPAEVPAPLDLPSQPGETNPLPDKPEPLATLVGMPAPSSVPLPPPQEGLEGKGHPTESKSPPRFKPGQEKKTLPLVDHAGNLPIQAAEPPLPTEPWPQTQQQEERFDPAGIASVDMPQLVSNGSEVGSDVPLFGGEMALPQSRRKPYIVAIFGVVGLIVLTGFVGIIFGTCKKSSNEFAASSEVASVQSSSASAVSSEPLPALSIAPETKAPKVATPAKPCTYTGPRSRLVVGASKDVPLEVWSHHTEAHVAVGFAAHNGGALGFVVDPKTMSPQRTFSKPMAATLTRVVPMRTDDLIQFTTDSDDPEESVRNRLTVPMTPPVLFGTFKGSLTIGLSGEPVPEILWQAPFSGPFEAMKAIPVQEKGVAVVFRADDALWLGWVDVERKPIGSLHKIPGTGVKVGTPSLGYNGQNVLLTFANLEDAQGQWTIRLVELQFGQAPPEGSQWSVPEGGPGGALIAPSLLGLDDGRWVMVWTEGNPGSRAVRVQTLDDELSPTGEAFVASQPGANAGQGLAAMGKSGGAVFYLSALGKHYEVWGAGIDCP